MIGFYIRRSRPEKDGDDRNTIERQRQVVKDYADKVFPGIGYVEYIDMPHSGMDFDRDAWKQMIEDCKTRKIDTVIAKDLGRIGRDYPQVNEYLETIFPMLNIRVIAILDHYDSGENGGEADGLDIFVKAKNVMNTFYVKDIAMKQMSALRAKWKRGMLTSRMTPYGYYCEDIHKGWNVDAEAAEVVTRIFREKLEGRSNFEIASGLNADHIETPGQRMVKMGWGDTEERGGKPVDKQVWTGTIVARVLKEESYTGVLIQGKEVCYNPGRKMTRRTEPDEQFRHEGHHDALIDRKTWEAVQSPVSSRTKKTETEGAERRKQDTDHFFKGILRCGNCGCLMTHRSSGYRCPKHGQHQYSGCPDKSFAEDELKAQTWTEIQRLQKLAREKLGSRLVADAEDIAELEDEVKRLTDLRLQKYDELINGQIGQDEFVELRDIIGRKLNVAETELGRLKALAADRERMEKALTPLVELKELTSEGLRTVADAVFVDDRGIRVKLKAREFLVVG